MLMQQSPPPPINSVKTALKCKRVIPENFQTLCYGSTQMIISSIVEYLWLSLDRLDISWPLRVSTYTIHTIYQPSLFRNWGNKLARVNAILQIFQNEEFHLFLRFVRRGPDMR